MRLISAIALLVLLGVSTASASEQITPMRVMSFNVMCSFCGHNDEIGHLPERMAGIADTINRHNPDLISVQELFTGSQVRKLQKKLKGDYQVIHSRGLIGFSDPTLFIRKSRYRVIRRGGFWLGPTAPFLSFGWKPAFPRRVQWAEIEERATGLRFTFAGTHFDNSPKNKTPSAKLVVKRFLPGKYPVLFAGDTNLYPALEGYTTLATAFRDTFTEVDEHPYVANGPSINSDGCNLEKASTFPECRVDHVLLSPKAPWRTKRWSLDTFKYTKGFVSDHRALIVDLE